MLRLDRELWFCRLCTLLRRRRMRGRALSPWTPGPPWLCTLLRRRRMRGRALSPWTPGPPWPLSCITPLGTRHMHTRRTHAVATEITSGAHASRSTGVVRTSHSAIVMPHVAAAHAVVMPHVAAAHAVDARTSMHSHSACRATLMCRTKKGPNICLFSPIKVPPPPQICIFQIRIW
jgi:hypothetical protein